MNTNLPDTDRHSMDLTQLSSREQLSALMDGALPADQTRFLLRRLQHDDSLAGSWERWRMAGEAMRGLAPTQRLPADFAQRVSAALHGEVDADADADAATTASRMPAWVRWGGGAAMAASLAVVALIASRPGGMPAEGAPPAQVAAVAADAPQAPAAPELPAVPATVAEAPALVAAAAAAASQPGRTRKAERTAAARQAPAPRLVAEVDASGQPTAHVAVPQPPIATRRWPRSVLPQYANGGLAVGFGDATPIATPHNPFRQPRLVMVPAQAPATDAEAHADQAPEADVPAATDAPAPSEP